MSLAKIQPKDAAFYTSKLVQVRERPGDYNVFKPQVENDDSLSIFNRIPVHLLMDLKIDYAFKQLFGQEKNKKMTIAFLNAILKRTGRNRIKDITFVNVEKGRKYEEDKQSRLDLLVVTESEERINLEVQFTNKYNMVNRSTFYWAGEYRGPLKKDMDYKDLRPVIAINILNFEYFNETELYHTSFHLYEDEEKFKLTDMIEFHFIEIPKFVKTWQVGKLDPHSDALIRWLLLLGMVDRKNGKVYDDIQKELEEIAMKDPMIHDAVEGWEELSMTHEQYLAYESRLKQVLDEVSYRNEQKRIDEENKRAAEENKRAAEENRRIAEKLHQWEKQLENQVKNQVRYQVKIIVIQLLQNQIELDVIANATGLTIDQIIEIKHELSNDR